MVVNPPKIVGHICPYNESIQIVNYISGVSIKVRIDGNDFQGLGHTAVCLGEVDVGTSLRQDQLVTVTQGFQRETSDRSPAIPANKFHTQIKYLTALSHLNEFGKGMRVEGGNNNE